MSSEQFEKDSLRLLSDIRDLLEIQLGVSPGGSPENVLKRTKAWFAGRGKPGRQNYHRHQPPPAEKVHHLVGR